ncbi:MAG: sigma 54-interacting transcriptional regulator [Bryobacteraceae bacterium]
MHRPEILETIFDQLSDAFFVYDKGLRIVGVNQSAQRLFGVPCAEMIGKHCRELFRCADPKPAMLSTGTIALHTKVGPDRMLVVRTVQLLDDSGAVEGMVATVKNIAQQAAPGDGRIVAESRAMLDLLEFVRRVAISEVTSILIEGENGTGKDLIARALHYRSVRQSKPFVAINCAAIPATLLESELFGYEKGAFTDAQAQKTGLFELADKGTLFLDEIAELPLSLQAKLLRVLENQCFRRVGGLCDIPIDVRVVAATNKDLQKAVQGGALRQDLYYRLNVIQLTVPPLRERPQDVLPLAVFFIEHYNLKFKRQIDGISARAENLLLLHQWPGNVRELRNAIERAMILEDTRQIRPASLPIAVCPANDPQFTSQRECLAEQERRLVLEALEKTGGDRPQSAMLLGITRHRLRYKMKKFDLH